VTGRVVHVLRRGELIVRDGMLVPGVAAGRFVPRSDPVAM
jgi:hypothetical protein